MQITLLLVAQKASKTKIQLSLLKRRIEISVEKVKQISSETVVVGGYSNNHYGARAVVDKPELREMLRTPLSEKLKKQRYNMLEISFSQ